MGDDLGDDFEISEAALISEGGGGAYASEEEVAASDESSDNGSEYEGVEESSSPTSSKEKKKAKRKAKLLEVKAKKKKKLEEEANENSGAVPSSLSAVSLSTAKEQLALFSNCQPRRKEDGSQAIHLEESTFLDPSSYNGKHAAKWRSSPFTMAVAAALPSLEALHHSSDEMGCPRVLVCCAGALRASHTLNSMSAHLKCAHAKVWSKHFKVPAQVEALGKKPYPIAVGTPARVAKLFEVGALDARRLQLVILDMAQNQKNFHLLSLPDTQQDTYSLIETYLLPRIKEGTCKISLVSSTEHFSV